MRKILFFLLPLMLLAAAPVPPPTVPLCVGDQAQLILLDHQELTITDRIVCQVSLGNQDNYVIFTQDGTQSGYDVSGIRTSTIAITRTEGLFPYRYGWIYTTGDYIFLPMVVR